MCLSRFGRRRRRLRAVSAGGLSRFWIGRKRAAFREGENPARWRGHLSNLLPRPSKVRTAKHYAALPYAEIGAFMSELRSRDGVAAAALEFLILTTARSSEVAGARWAEID